MNSLLGYNKKSTNITKINPRNRPVDNSDRLTQQERDGIKAAFASDSGKRIWERSMLLNNNISHWDLCEDRARHVPSIQVSINPGRPEAYTQNTVRYSIIIRTTEKHNDNYLYWTTPFNLTLRQVKAKMYGIIKEWYPTIQEKIHTN